MAHRLNVYPERCVGCRLCSVACSMVKTGECGLAAARIWVAHFGEESRYVPITCTHCEDAWCIRACPAGAITRRPGGRRTTIDDSRCVGCRACTLACPFGAVVHHAASGKAIKCDECDGEPYCVGFCPTGAIAWEDEGAVQHRRRLDTAQRLAAGSDGPAARGG